MRVIALVVTLLLVASPVLADENTVAANVQIPFLIGDDLTTRSILAHGGYERNWLTKGVVRSNWGIALSSVAINVLERLLFKHAPNITRAFTGLEINATVNNAIVLGHF